MRAMRWIPGVSLGLAVAAAATAPGCAHRRCDSNLGAECRASGAPADAASPLRIYAVGDAGKTGEERAQALALLRQTIAAEPAGGARALAVLGNNIYERGILSGDAELAASKSFYAELFAVTEWKSITVVPGNYDHGALRHGGFDAKAIAAQAAWFRQLRPDVIFPAAADPRSDSPWTTSSIPGLEECVTFVTTDSQGYRENLLALPAPKSPSAWSVAIAHHPTRTAANHMGDRTRDEYDAYAKALEPVDLLLAGHENVLFADLDPKDATHEGPPNIVSGAFSKVQRLKAPELTRCGSEQPGFVRVSVVGDALVADFFSLKPGDAATAKPYCTQAIQKAGTGAKCGGAQAAVPPDAAPATP